MDTTGLLDSYGRMLLDLLQEDARLPFSDLGRRIGLSPTATAERLRQMQEAGIIRRYSVDIDREALGLHMFAFVRITCDGPNYGKFLEFVRNTEEIRECHHLTGSDAFLLKVITTCIADLEALIEALLPYGTPTTSIVYSSPVENRRFGVNSKLTSFSAKKPPIRRNRGIR